MPKFKWKPVEIEAMQFTGENTDEVNKWTDGKSIGCCGYQGVCLQLKTIEGTMTATVGDWIIKNVSGEIIMRKPDIFEATYESVE